MAKTKTSWQRGSSGNAKGRPPGTGRIEAYRKVLDAAMPHLLKQLVEKAKSGDLSAIKLILDRTYPTRDAVVSDLMADIEELRAMIEESRKADRTTPHEAEGDTI